MLGDRRDTLPGDAAVENNINLTPCHSRAGGNPFGLSDRDGTMDSRLRGNDSQRRVSWITQVMDLFV